MATKTNHLEKARFWIRQEFKGWANYNNEERHEAERDAVQQAQAHAQIAIAEALQKLANKPTPIGTA